MQEISNNAHIKISKSVETHVLQDSLIAMSEIYTLGTPQI
jgi:hypothetical protein